MMMKVTLLNRGSPSGCNVACSLLRSSPAIRFLGSLTDGGVVSQHHQHRRYFSDGVVADRTRNQVGKVAVIGGGPSGLSCAYYLKKRASELGVNSITLFEGSNRVGGWIRSQTLGGDSGDVSSSPDRFLFDAGPRSLRGSTASALYTIRLIEELGLQEELISGSTASSKRIIYVNGKLEQLSLMSRLGLTTMIPAGISEMLKPKRKVDETGDESIYSFFARRFSVEVAEVMASALTLGIFGGNAKTLSIRTCFPMLCDVEQEHRSVILGMIGSSLAKRRQQQEPHQIKDSEFVKATSKLSIFSFKSGLEVLTKTMAASFNNSSSNHHLDCRMMLSTRVSSLSPLNNRKGVIVNYVDTSGAVKSEEFDHVISAVVGT